MTLARPVRQGSEVYEHLLQKLMSLDIQPDERIAVDRLARDLGVSQTSVCEALHQLETQGLVLRRIWSAIARRPSGPASSSRISSSCGF
jgi:DNA-binding GntR family transcriptional regulator